MTLGELAAELAAQSVGVMEEPLGSNSGPYVDQYIRSVGLTPPEPWCACFVYYKVHEAAEQMGVTSDWPRTGSTVAIADWADMHSRWLDAPVPGCVFLVARDPDAGDGWHHTGFVLAVNGDGTVTTVEGNSNDSGSSEGIGVFRLTRRADPLWFVRIS